MATGTHVLADLLANRDVTVAEYGEQEVHDLLQEDLRIHNENYNRMVETLAFHTTEKLLSTSGGSTGGFEEVDEQARVRTQKAEARQTMGIPLRRFERAAGFTRDFLEVATLGDIRRIALQVQKDDVDNLHKMVRRALFRPTNYTFYDEYGSPQVDLAVKALLNADGSAIPTGPNGEEFDGDTHSHYLANASLTADLVDQAVETVVEHGVTEGVEILVNRTNVGAFAALTGKFLPAVGPLVRPGMGADTALITAEAGKVDNTAVGVWDGRHVVRSRPWIPAGYFAVVATGQAEEARPLAIRTPTVPSRQGLHLNGELDMYPLRADYYRRFAGVAAYNRQNAAVAQFTNATYSMPPGV